MPEDSFLYMIDSMLKTCKWFALQALLFFLMPYVWNYEYSASTLVLMLVYTMLYALYWNFVPTSKQVRLLYLPYLAYVVIGVVVYFSTGDWCTSLWQVVLLPLYGAICFVGVKLFKKGVRKLRNRFRWGGVVAYTSLALFFILLKASSVAWMRADTKVENAILRTAEAAGHTVVMGHQRHYLLANVALVGESIMLAMRTHR